MGRAVWLAAAAALLLRLGALGYLGDPLFVGRAASSWDWGYEQAAIGRALAQGEGFAHAFDGAPAWRGAQRGGPTGWAAPAYPALFALLSRLFGAGPALAWALALVQAVVSALTCLALARLARGLGRGDLASSAAWVWALYPQAIWYPVTLVWDSTLVACGLVWWLSAVACAGRGVRWRRAFLLGLGLGALLLVNPAPVAIAPAALVFLRGGWRTAAALAGGVLAVTGPWMARNQVAVGSAGLRTNLGVELMVGNNDRAQGQWVAELHPAYSIVEAARCRELGEAGYAREARGRALEWIQDHPRRFLELSAVRLRRFWIGAGPFQEQRDWMGWVEWAVGLGTGLAALAALLLWRGAPGSGWLVRGPLLLFPAVYAVTHVLPRYRFPLDGVVVLAGVAVVAEARKRRAGRRVGAGSNPGGSP